jgi:hypothetical protein
MAVKEKTSSGGRHWIVGFNVILMVVLAVALVAGLQWIGFAYSSRADLTSSGVNSLSDATKRMLSGIQTEVRITSMYFETDLENKDQDRFRSAVDDLIDLYHATNRAKIVTDSVNPLKDLEKRKAIFRRFAELPKFKNEAAGHREAVERFRSDLLARVGDLISSELAQIEALPAMQGEDARLATEVKQLYGALQRDLEQTSQSVADALASEIPALGAAVNTIQQAYTAVSRAVKNVSDVGKQLAAAPNRLSPPVREFFVGAGERYAALTADLEAETGRLSALPSLEFDNIVGVLGSEISNSILVETDEDARVIDFSSVWPPLNPRAERSGFDDRSFLGEQKLTSAILQLTQTEKPAVVFIRHGGPPLFVGGFIPGQPQPVLRQMMEQLEDANFAVYEWDLATQDEMPELQEKASRTIFVVTRPEPSMPSMMGQPPETPPFTPQKLEAVKKALGESPRALFTTGYLPGMGGAPSPYEYSNYLSATWGIDAPSDRLLIFAEPIGGGVFKFTRYPTEMIDCRFADVPLASGVAEMRTVFPLVAPIRKSEDAPKDVSVEMLAWFDQHDGLWSISDVPYYVAQKPEHVVPAPDDHSGEFMMAATATRGDAKIAVISSNEFYIDAVALAPELVMTGQGLAMRSKNPGNAALFINTLHWLNDNTEWVNLGTPIERSTLSVAQDSGAMTFVQALVLGIWPGLAACAGLVVWLVRRR